MVSETIHKIMDKFIVLNLFRKKEVGATKTADGDLKVIQEVFVPEVIPAALAVVETPEVADSAPAVVAVEDPAVLDNIFFL